MRIYQCTGSELEIKIMAGEEASMLLMKISVTIEVGEINTGSLLKQNGDNQKEVYWFSYCGVSSSKIGGNNGKN